jgi:integrase
MPESFRNHGAQSIWLTALRHEFKKFMRMCGLPKLTVHSWRYIYATRLYLMGVHADAIKDILGIDKKTLKYYVKAT